jgi:hypothetical protein
MPSVSPRCRDRGRHRGVASYPLVSALLTHQMVAGLISPPQIDGILDRADLDGNCEIEYEGDDVPCRPRAVLKGCPARVLMAQRVRLSCPAEFVKEAPRTLKVNLVKLAKQNGAELGFLS